MAKRKRKGGRRRPKPGIGQIAVGAATIADISGGRFLKNALTDAVRTSYTNQVQKSIPGPAGAVAAAIIFEYVRHEANKMHVNPSYGPVRLL